LVVRDSQRSPLACDLGDEEDLMSLAHVVEQMVRMGCRGKEKSIPFSFICVSTAERADPS
jgi:hypothetical protein